MRQSANIKPFFKIKLSLAVLRRIIWLGDIMRLDEVRPDTD